MKPEPIRCELCGTLFGYANGDTLTIKHRDLYRSIQGKVEGPCRRCGAMVRWPQKMTVAKGT